MRVRTYPLLRSAIENGVVSGLAKAEKRGYVTLRNNESAADEIQNYIMNEICEYFDWDDEVARGES